MMASSSWRRAASPKTFLASSSRCRQPWASITSLPKWFRISASAGWPGSTTRRASRSVSTTGTPCCSRKSTEVDLPMPIPPVSPMRVMSTHDALLRFEAADGEDRLSAQGNRFRLGGQRQRREEWTLQPRRLRAGEQRPERLRPGGRRWRGRRQAGRGIDGRCDRRRRCGLDQCLIIELPEVDVASGAVADHGVHTGLSETDPGVISWSGVPKHVAVEIVRFTAGPVAKELLQCGQIFFRHFTGEMMVLIALGLAV